MKNTVLITIASVLGISTFLFFVSLGITAEATMIGITILVGWAAVSMLAIELRGSILENQRMRKAVIRLSEHRAAVVPLSAADVRAAA